MKGGVLQAGGVCKSFGGLKAVQEFAIELHPGEVRGLIGPNGAGKTTVFNLLTGVYTPDRGKVVLDGRLLNGLRPCRICEAGLARTFQNIRLFGDLSVLDNVKIACHVRAEGSLAGVLARTRGAVGEERRMTASAMRLLHIFELADRAGEQARSLPYGDQRKLEIARALATEPRVLLLDEPAAGMNPQEKIELRALIRRVSEEFGVTILLIEHDMGVIMDICGHITVLDHGCVISRGTPAQVQADPKVIEAYLGAPGGEAPGA